MSGTTETAAIERGGHGGWLTGLRGKLVIAIGVVLSGTLIAAVVAIVGYANFGATLDNVIGRAVPSMTSALRVAQQAERLVAIAPALAAVQNFEEKQAVSTRIMEEKAEFEARLEALEEAGLSDEVLSGLRQISQELLANLVMLDSSISSRVELTSDIREFKPRLAEIHKQIEGLLAPWKSVYRSENEAVRGALTSASASEADLRNAAKQFIESEERFRPVRELDENVATARTLLDEAVETTDPNRLTIIQTNMNLLIARAETARSNMPEKLATAVGTALDELRTLSLEGGNIFEKRDRELKVTARSRGLLSDNHDLSQRLGTQIASLVEEQKRGIDQASSATRTMLENSRWLQIAVAVVSVIASILIVWLYIGRILIKRLMALKQSMRRIADGDLDVDIPTGGSDEISDMAEALVVFRDGAIENRRLVAEQERMKRQAEEERKKALTRLADRFQTGVGEIIQRLAGASSTMRSRAQTMAEAAQLTNQRSLYVSTASEMMTSNIQAVAAATEEMNATVSEIARQVGQSADIARKAVEETERTDGTVSGMAEAASRIGEVVDLITDIAAQTNLLALNATIEAARAGEAGKGFAVVATEVKNLADQTAKATGEIAEQVHGVQSVAREAVEAIRGIRETIGDVYRIAAEIVTATEQQRDTTVEISQRVNEVARGTQEVADDMTTVSQAAQETGGAAAEVLTAAEDLSSQTDVLGRDVEAFLKEMRTS